MIPSFDTKERGFMLIGNSQRMVLMSNVIGTGGATDKKGLTLLCCTESGIRESKQTIDRIHWLCPCERLE